MGGLVNNSENEGDNNYYENDNDNQIPATFTVPLSMFGNGEINVKMPNFSLDGGDYNEYYNGPLKIGDLNDDEDEDDDNNENDKNKKY